jgi:hypothetical protein
MEIENLGFFRELPHGDPEGESLIRILSMGDVAVQEFVAGYLEKGTVLAATAQRVFDVLDDEKSDAGQLAVMTDGVWVWPADLPYYVRKYNISLPGRFVEHAKLSKWTPPKLSTKDLLDIESKMHLG